MEDPQPNEEWNVTENGTRTDPVSLNGTDTGTAVPGTGLGTKQMGCNGTGNGTDAWNGMGVQHSREWNESGPPPPEKGTGSKKIGP